MLRPEYEVNVAYTQEGLEDRLDTIRGFYTLYKLDETKEVDIEKLFKNSDLEYPGDEAFPFKIELESWKSEKYWRYSRLVVRYKKLNHKKEEVDVETYIERNYDSTYLYVVRQNGTYFLLFGHDYQGIAALNLTTQKISYYMPKAALEEGMGFCITDMENWDEENSNLLVEVCFWGWNQVKRDYKIEDLHNITLTNLILDGYDYPENEDEEEETNDSI